MAIARNHRRMNPGLPGIFLGLLWHVLAANATPPPPGQSVANCTNPTYASDRLVCADFELLGLDLQLRDALAQIELAQEPAPGSLVEEQDAWFRRRSLCSFSASQAACLRAAYSERLLVLELLRKTSPEGGQDGAPAMCHGAPWKSAEVHIRLRDGGFATVTDSDGRVLAVAFDTEPRDDWTPFVRVDTEETRVRLTPLGQDSFECRVRVAAAP